MRDVLHIASNLSYGVFSFSLFILSSFEKPLQIHFSNIVFSNGLQNQLSGFANHSQYHFLLNTQEVLHNLLHFLFFTDMIMNDRGGADLFDGFGNCHIAKLGKLIHQAKSLRESYLSWSMASITLLVNLKGLAVEAITVLVLVSPVSSLYFPYTLAATAVWVSMM